MTELNEYKKQMGLDDSKIAGMKYKMSRYDDFLKANEYRKKNYGIANQRNIGRIGHSERIR